jgi:hypothetical protein
MTKQTLAFVSVLIIAAAGTVTSYCLWRNKHLALEKVPIIKQTQIPVKTQEKPLAPEQNPPGDIPDSQVFVKYNSPVGGYELQVPEGWGRTVNGANVSFVDKFDGVQVSVTKIAEVPTVASVKSQQAVELQKNGRAVRITDLKEMKMAKETAILIAYEANSAPDPVTGKQIRLENQAYLFYKNGKLATLTLWAPLGADNVDQWRLITNSFGRWQ